MNRGAGGDDDAAQVAGFIEEQEKCHSQGGHKAYGHRVIVETSESDFPQIVESAEVPAVEFEGDISLTNNDDPCEFPQVSSGPNGRDTDQKWQQDFCLLFNEVPRMRWTVRAERQKNAPQPIAQKQQRDTPRRTQIPVAAATHKPVQQHGAGDIEAESTLGNMAAPQAVRTQDCEGNVDQKPVVRINAGRRDANGCQQPGKNQSLHADCLLRTASHRKHDLVCPR